MLCNTYGHNCVSWNSIALQVPFLQCWGKTIHIPSHRKWFYAELRKSSSIFSLSTSKSIARNKKKMASTENWWIFLATKVSLHCTKMSYSNSILHFCVSHYYARLCDSWMIKYYRLLIHGLSLLAFKFSFPFFFSPFDSTSWRMAFKTLFVNHFLNILSFCNKEQNWIYSSVSIRRKFQVFADTNILLFSRVCLFLINIT